LPDLNIFFHVTSKNCIIAGINSYFTLFTFIYEFTTRQYLIFSGAILGNSSTVKPYAIEIAKNALREGAAIDFIKKITGLDESTIRDLQTEIAS